MAKEYVDIKIIKWIGVLFTVGLFAFALFLPMLACACKQVSRLSWTISNCKQTSLATIMYAADFDDYLPSGHRWTEKVGLYAKNTTVFNVKLSTGDRARRFALNKSVTARQISKLETKNGVMLFDSISNGGSPVGGKVLLAKYPKRDIFVIAFLDGHVKGIRTNQLAELIWNPSNRK